MALNTIPWGQDFVRHTSEETTKKDWAYWQNRINRASLVMLTEEGIINRDQAKIIAQAQKKAEEIQDVPGAKRFTDIMPLEKLLIENCGPLASLIHTGRSRQDIFATLYQARLRLDFLDFFENFNNLRARMLEIALNNSRTWMPAYTNGVQAMPITFGFYLWAFLESFERDSDRLKEAWSRINQSALGTAVLACSAWPLSRERLSALLGFDKPITNGLDSLQVSLFDIPIEAAGIVSNIAIRISVLVQDLAQQYSQSRPWMLLESGAAYSSSAMPQKRNPGILNKTRAKASTVIAEAHMVTIRAHNLNLGMYDNKDSVSDDCSRVFAEGVYLLQLMDWAYSMLKVNPERALEELNSDWTCTMALAEGLQMEKGIPFRVGHNFASDIVTEARKQVWLPMTFPYVEAQKIYRQVTKRLTGIAEELPIDEKAFRKFLTPEYVVCTRVGKGSPSPENTLTGLNSVAKRLKEDRNWLEEKRQQLSKADKSLDGEFENLL